MMGGTEERRGRMKGMKDAKDAKDGKGGKGGKGEGREGRRGEKYVLASWVRKCSCTPTVRRRARTISSEGRTELANENDRE